MFTMKHQENYQSWLYSEITISRIRFQQVYNNNLEQQNMQIIIDQAQLQALVNQYGITPEFQKYFNNWNIKKRFKYLNMCPSAISKICRRIAYGIQKDPINLDLKKDSLWIKGQFKLFIWVSAFYSFHLQRSLKHFKNRDFQFLASIFVTKSIERMKYQMKILTATKKFTRKRWSQKEIQMLKQILKKYQEKQWKSISFELFCKSQGQSFRTYGQCREVWSNHLNEKVNKEKWTQQQDELLLKLVKENNKWWSKISQHFGGLRSCHMIKNRYHILLKREATKNIESTEMKELELAHSLSNTEKSQAMELSPKLITTLSIIQSQILDIYHYCPQQDRSEQKSINKPAQKFTQESLAKMVNFQVESQQIWSYGREIQNSKKLVDYDFENISKFFNESNLLQQLGCSHFQQIQLALQQQSEMIVIEE